MWRWRTRVWCPCQSGGATEKAVDASVAQHQQWRLKELARLGAGEGKTNDALGPTGAVDKEATREGLEAQGHTAQRAEQARSSVRQWRLGLTGGPQVEVRGYCAGLTSSGSGGLTHGTRWQWEGDCLGWPVGPGPIIKIWIWMSKLYWNWSAWKSYLPKLQKLEIKYCDVGFEV
jgi:hypothetical protein